MASFSLNFHPISISSRSKLLVQCSSYSPPHVNCGVQPIVVTGDPPTFVSAPGRRIVAVGDLHGDISQTRSALEIAGILSSDGYRWIGGSTVLVQLGDILDRGEDEIAILSLLKSLSLQAKSTGGAVFQVNGNHETMNVEEDFRYVDPGAFNECINFLQYFEECDRNWNHAFLSWNFLSRKVKETHRYQNSTWNFLKRQKGVSARSALLRPGGALACELANNPVVIKINDWIFCHGGLLPHHVIYGVEKMNKEVSDWMRDAKQQTPMPFIATRGYDSVVWNRLYSREPDSQSWKYEVKIKEIELASESAGTNSAHLVPVLYSQSWKVSSMAEKTLEKIKAGGMVVGHTPQINGANCSKYDNRVWCIDVGMSSGVLNSSPEVLEIVNNKARVLKSRSDFFDGVEVVDYI